MADDGIWSGDKLLEDATGDVLGAGRRGEAKKFKLDALQIQTTMRLRMISLILPELRKVHATVKEWKKHLKIHQEASRAINFATLISSGLALAVLALSKRGAKAANIVLSASELASLGEQVGSFIANQINEHALETIYDPIQNKLKKIDECEETINALANELQETTGKKASSWISLPSLR